MVMLTQALTDSITLTIQLIICWVDLIAVTQIKYGTLSMTQEPYCGFQNLNLLIYTF